MYYLRELRAVSFAVFYPNLQITLSGSEDSAVKVQNNRTYCIENTLSYSLERACCVAIRRNINEVATGFDEG
jgi:coatomer subunit beta'